MLIVAFFFMNMTNHNQLRMFKMREWFIDYERCHSCGNRYKRYHVQSQKLMNIRCHLALGVIYVGILEFLFSVQLN